MAGVLVLYFRRKSMYDPLTGLPVYHVFTRKAQKAIRSCLRKGVPFSIALIDLDAFRRFNERSYSEGDKMLSAFSSFLKTQQKHDEYFGRFRAGDEFILMFPGKNSEEAHRRIEETERQLKTRIFSFSGKHNEIGFSSGIACTSRHVSLEHLVEEAGAALRMAKKCKAVRKVL